MALWALRRESLMDNWKERSTSYLSQDYAAWGNYQEVIRIGCFPTEQTLIDQVHLGSPLGMALCEVVQAGHSIRLDIMAGPPQRADALTAVIRWKLSMDRRELNEATPSVELEAKARRL